MLLYRVLDRRIATEVELFDAAVNDARFPCVLALREPYHGTGPQ